MTAMNEDVRKTCALVVEDDPNIVDLIRSNLAVRGFDTVGGALYTTAHLYELYLDCARRSLDLAITASPSPPPVIESRS